jgi:uncharacterized phage protein (TIGR01671 family)
MREILFRGKTPRQDEHFDDGEWVEGFYTRFNGKEHRIYSGYAETDCGDYYPDWFNVRPETVGQYTGLTDKNGKRIFEGDIVKNDWCFMCGNSVIKFGQYKPLDMGNEYQQGHLGFYLEHIHKADKRSVRKDIVYFANNCEIIGNIHDNPELLKGE